MLVIDNLVALFEVDRRLRALQAHQDAATRDREHTQRTLKTLEARCEELVVQRRQVEAAIHNLELETASIDERIEKMRVELNQASTNRQYTTLLESVTAAKEQRRMVEDRILVEMERAEQLDGRLTETRTRIEHGQSACAGAEERLEACLAEHGDQLATLHGERSTAASVIPVDELELFESCAEDFEGEAMASIEEIDRKRKEYACGSCNMMLPHQQVRQVLGHKDGVLPQCPACQRILYAESSLRDSIASGS